MELAPPGTRKVEKMSSRSKSSGRQAKPPATRQETSRETRQETTLAQDILMDLPLLMHGSGDARPEDVDPESVAVLAGCVERYVRSLVSAALDSLDARTDGQVVGGGGCLGVPPYRGGGESGVPSGRGAATTEPADEPRRKKRKVDYWDLPPGSNRDVGEAFDEGEDSPLLKYRLASTSAGAASRHPPVPVEDQPLLGFAPVDLHEDERTRGHYMTPSSALSARDFIFPICHDAELYERVKEVQASRRMMARDLVDESLLDIIRSEGAEIGKAPQVDLLDAVLSGDGKGGAVPGSAGGKDKSDDKETKKEMMRMVGASLLDGDVEAMWPGCNPVMRPSWS